MDAPTPTMLGRSDVAPGQPRATRPPRSVVDDELLQILEGAEDLRAGVRNAITVLRREHGRAGVEWWTSAADGRSWQVELQDGASTGRRVALPMGAAGALVLTGGPAPEVEAALARLRPLLHHWWTAERLAGHVSELARTNAALEDFAALVAHDVKASLLSALRGDARDEGLARTLEIVDSILEATRVEAADPVGPLADAVQAAVADIGETDAKVVVHVTGRLPIPAASLRFVLRNLLANALAAGARTVHVASFTLGERPVVIVADDGVGLGANDGYASGTQLGLALCRRLLARYGATLVLKRRGVIGTGAVIVFEGQSA